METVTVNERGDSMCKIMRDNYQSVKWKLNGKQRKWLLCETNRQADYQSVKWEQKQWMKEVTVCVKQNDMELPVYETETVTVSKGSPPVHVQKENKRKHGQLPADDNENWEVRRN